MQNGIHPPENHASIEIQQNNKQSLAAYIHRFQREAKRCNFNNNAAMIWIFIKGLKNTHTLASHVNEKGPQTLVDAINEVEKLQAAQQVIATLLPSSNSMYCPVKMTNASSVENWDTWHTIGHIYDVLIVMSMVM